MVNIGAEIVWQSWLVLGQMAPYLLLGFLVAGLLSVGISPAWVERRLGRGGLGPVITASLVGVPLPLCSCGVIPVAASIRRHGASRGATTALLLSTPQTGVDSIAVTYALLGPVFAVFRPLVALVTGIVGGFLVQLFDRADEHHVPADSSLDPCADGCHDARADAGNDACSACSNDSTTGALHETSPQATCTEACCEGGRQGSVIVRALRYGFVTLPRDIGPALIVGIVVAGAIGALVPEDHLRAYVGSGVLSILLAMAAGVPIYVCATASVPIAVGLIHLGVSPGAALAFLIAGPATNAATLTTAWRVLGRRATIVYLATVAVSAVACGLLLDWLIPTLGAAAPQLGGGSHAEPAGHWLSGAGAVAMLAVLVLSYASKGRKREPTETRS